MARELAGLGPLLKGPTWSWRTHEICDGFVCAFGPPPPALTAPTRIWHRNARPPCVSAVPAATLGQDVLRPDRRPAACDSTGGQTARQHRQCRVPVSAAGRHPRVQRGGAEEGVPAGGQAPPPRHAAGVGRCRGRAALQAGGRPAPPLAPVHPTPLPDFYLHRCPTRTRQYWDRLPASARTHVRVAAGAAHTRGQTHTASGISVSVTNGSARRRGAASSRESQKDCERTSTCAR